MSGQPSLADRALTAIAGISSIADDATLPAEMRLWHLDQVRHHLRAREERLCALVAGIPVINDDEDDASPWLGEKFRDITEEMARSAGVES